MRALSPLACALVVLASSAALADGGVAVAVTLPDKSPVHRDFAAGMVGEAYERFEMLSPALTPDEVASCQVEERCLLALAQKRAASHLMLVGVASLGPTEHVVSLRVLDIASGAELVNLSDLADPGADPAAAGKALAARAFASAQGLPPRVEAPAPSPDPDPAVDETRAPLRRWTGLNPLSLVGWGVVGAATVGAGGALLAGVPLFIEEGGDIEQYALLAGSGVAGALALGFGLVATDAWVLNGE